jgi:ABC-type spermidine/putrescine transport system permease subunit I
LSASPRMPQREARRGTEARPGNPPPAVDPDGRLRQRRPLMPTRRREQVVMRLFLAPLLIVFVALFALPVARSLYFSFTNFGGYSSKVSFVGFANYTALFSDPQVLTGLTFAQRSLSPNSRSSMVSLCATGVAM